MIVIFLFILSLIVGVLYFVVPRKQINIEPSLKVNEVIISKYSKPINNNQQIPQDTESPYPLRMGVTFTGTADSSIVSASPSSEDISIVSGPQLTPIISQTELRNSSSLYPETFLQKLVKEDDKKG